MTASAPSSTGIPRILHQIWYQGEAQMPDKFRRFSEGWRANHPDWSFHLWNETTMRTFMAEYYAWFLPVYDGYPFNIQRIDAVRDTLIVAGAGVGGGSLVYANTLYEPLDAFYRDPSWAHITDWKSELAPYYDQAKRMLGVSQNPLHTPADEVMKKVADDMGVGDTFHPTPVGVFFGGPGAGMGQEVDDPFFGGAGPTRRTCIGCGSCMTGCRGGGKNTLMKNYLHLAERAGAVVHPLTTVTRVRPRPEGGWLVETVRSGSWFARRTVRRWS